MFSSLRSRLTYANVIATFALVFAMTGGAYAAKRYLITSVKQISPSVQKQLAGKTGAAGKAGSQGPQGLPGANGKDGAPGINGKDGGPGSNGKSVVAATEPKGTHCKEGGENLEVEGSGNKSYVCNGAEGKEGQAGSPWMAGGVVPQGKSISGTWAGVLVENPAYTPAHITTSSAISFSLPLKSAPTVLYVKEGETVTHCSGTISAPAADEGYLCVYAESPSEFIATYEEAASYTSGAVIQFKEGLSPELALHGTWAATGN